MLVFTESGHQIDENDEIDEKHPEIGGARELHHTDTNWSSRPRVWQRLEMPQPFFSNTFCLKCFGVRGGHSDDLRERHPVRAKKTFGGTQVYKGHGLTKTWFREP